MQITQTRRHAAVGSDAPVRDAQIAATPQMWRVLFDQIYADKELAIIRELSANAYDAHVAAGRSDVPIEIHLPTFLEPWLQITDYGTGLDPEHLPELYMDAGRSDKTNTNELIGGFGLGSKTPFCYTDSFTTTTRWNGTAHTFTAFLKEDGTPACIELGRQPTDKHNGLTVYMPIDITHRAETNFETALEKIYPYIPTAPTVTGSRTLNLKRAYDQHDILIDAKHIPKIRHIGLDSRHSLNFSERGLYIVQGIVPYKVDRSSITSQFPEHVRRFTDLGGRMVIYADIGTFDVAVSRETLSLNKRTEQALEQTLQAIATTLKQEFRNQLNAAPTWAKWDDLLQTTLLKNPPTPTQPFASYLDKYHLLSLEPLCNAFNVEYRASYTLNSKRADLQESTIFPHRAQQMRSHHIYVSQSRTHSMRRAVTHFFRNSSSKHISIFHGTTHDVRRLFDFLGLNEVTVEDMPIIAPPKGNHRALGRARYDSCIFRFTSNPDSKTISTTAPAFLERLEEHHPDSLTDVAVVIHEYASDAVWPYATHTFKHRLTSPYSHIYTLNITTTHSRVANTMAQECKERGAQVIRAIDNPSLKPLFRANPRGILRWLIRNGATAGLPAPPVEVDQARDFFRDLYKQTEHPDVHQAYSALQQLNRRPSTTSTSNNIRQLRNSPYWRSEFHTTAQRLLQRRFRRFDAARSRLGTQFPALRAYLEHRFTPEDPSRHFSPKHGEVLLAASIINTKDD